MVRTTVQRLRVVYANSAKVYGIQMEVGNEGCTQGKFEGILSQTDTTLFERKILCQAVEKIGK